MTMAQPITMECYNFLLLFSLQLVFYDSQVKNKPLNLCTGYIRDSLLTKAYYRRLCVPDSHTKRVQCNLNKNSKNDE